MTGGKPRDWRDICWHYPGAAARRGDGVDIVSLKRWPRRGCGCPSSKYERPHSPGGNNNRHAIGIAVIDISTALYVERKRYVEG
jgi:hypothetical protein